MTASPAVQIRGVSKSFGVVKALTNVELTVERGASLALLGRNGAGKSTLISIVTGLQTPDTGVVQFGDREPGDRRGVGCVYQKSTLVPGLTAAENIALNRYPRTSVGSIDWREVKRRGKERLDEWGCGHVADRRIEDLDSVDRKIVEICRVISADPDVLLLDEPTAGLDFGGAQRLFASIERARRKGVSIIYVSHHLEEVFEVCDTTAVLRDGKVVLNQRLDGLRVGDLVTAMVGDVEATKAIQQPPAILHNEPLLTVDAYSRNDRFQDVSFAVRPGECLGIAGLDGSGHIQVAEAMSGLVSTDGGEMNFRGVPVKGSGVRSRISAGINFIPEDRHNGGYVPALSVAENATLPVMGRIVNRLGILRSNVRERIYSELADEWSIKAWGPGQPVEELSGGNQQKVVLARAMSSDPAVLVLMNPTAGVDVTAKRSIYSTIKLNAEKGKAVIVASSDDEDFSICHRVIAMFRGKVHSVLEAPFSDADLAKAIQGELN
ncbi:sugar ABC transporter ATP-binding protein [Pseudarthrobacter oxydans]|uniref:sugar ABC transporter ATP-binding protein n=1 Tax=Pseudarthrobacter oxydans TaxID=1671 RepID=UPI003D28EE43